MDRVKIGTEFFLYIYIAVPQPLIPPFLGMLAAEMSHWKNVSRSFHNGEVSKGMIVQPCGI